MTTMTTHVDVPGELRALIAAVRRRWVRKVALRTAGQAMAAAAVPLVAALGVAFLTGAEGLSLVALAGAAAILAAVAAALPVYRVERRLDDRRVARFIEERSHTLSGDRALDDVLVSALDGVRHPERAAFLPLLLQDAVRRLRAIDPGEIVTPESLRGAAGLAAAGAAALAVALVVSAPTFSRALETARLRFFPGSVRVEVVPGHVRLPAGTPLRIRTTLHGSAGSLKHFTPSIVVAAGGEQRTVQMTAAGEAFELAIPSVDRTFTYTVTAGSARSEDYTVTAVFPPRVERIDLHYVYPSFAGLAPRDEQDGGDIYAPAGTRVRLRIHTDKAIAQGQIALGRAAAVAVRAVAPRTVEADLVLARDDSYRVRLSDLDGLRTSGDTEYFIRLMDDRPPDVRILRPSADQQITPLEEIAIEARADDDYGIAAFDLVYAVGGGPERVVPFDRVSGSSVQKIGMRLLPAEDLGVRPGDVITYYARARDVGRGKRSTRATSDIFFLEVTPFNEEFVAAQSQASSAGAAEAQIESLIQAQKAIIASTWNVERRSQAGRSAEDVKAIAQAQAELRTRAEQMGSRSGRGRLPMPVPQRTMAPEAQRFRQADGDPIANAVAAMAKARAAAGDGTNEGGAAARNGGAERSAAGAGGGAPPPGVAAGQRRGQRRIEPVRAGPLRALRQGAAASATHQLRDAVRRRDPPRPASIERQRPGSHSRSRTTPGGPEPPGARARPARAERRRGEAATGEADARADGASRAGGRARAAPGAAEPAAARATRSAGGVCLRAVATG